MDKQKRFSDVLRAKVYFFTKTRTVPRGATALHTVNFCHNMTKASVYLE